MSSTLALNDPEHSSSSSEELDLSTLQIQEDLSAEGSDLDEKPIFNTISSKKTMSEQVKQDGPALQAVKPFSPGAQASVAVPSLSFAALLKAVPLRLDGITKLSGDGSNFDLWEADLREFITFIPGAIHYLHHTAVPMAPGFVEEMANGVNSIIHWTIDRQLAMRIRKGNPLPCKRVEELRKLFSGTSYSNRLSLLSQLTSLKYEVSSGTVDIFFAQAANIRDRLEIAGMPITDDVFGGILALAVPKDFPDIAHTFEAGLLANPKHVIGSNAVMRVISAGDVSYKRGMAGPSEAMKVSVSDGSKDKRKCHYCSKEGHLARDCRKKAKDKKDGKDKPDVKSAELEPEAKDVDIGFTACVLPDKDKIYESLHSTDYDIFDHLQVELGNIDSSASSDDAIFDTGATHDVFNKREKFVEFKTIPRLGLKVANGSTSSFITGVGSVYVCNEFFPNKKQLLSNVYLCESLRHSLISGIAFRDNGGQFSTTENGIMLQFKNGEQIECVRRDRKWVLKVCDPEIDAAAVTGSYMLWHRRLGHPNDRVLNQMIRNSVCVGLPEKLTKSIPCEECAIMKSTKTPTIGSSLQTCDAPLNLVVADLCGPFQVKTVDGFEFALEIKDVYSTFLMTFLLKFKSEAPALVKGYIAEAERRTGCKVLFWRTDGGGEFVNKILKTFFIEKGISVQNSLPYVHEQNGIVERSNRTAQASMRVLLRDSGLPHSFWGLAMMTGTYLHNRTPNVNTQGKTPHERFFSTVPQADHLRIFGSWAFVHVPEERRKKLDDRAIKCRFVGYLSGVKGWRFWNPLNKQFISSAHARWLDEKEQSVTSTSAPIPDPSSSSSLDRILNTVSTFGLDFEVRQLFESLEIEFKLDDPVFTKTIRDQDEGVRRMQAMAAGIAMQLPRTYQEAVTGAHGQEWREACQKEMDMLMKMKVWDEVTLPKGCQVVSSKWVFAHKTNLEGEIVRRKSRFVVRGFTQKEGIDFKETFAPTARFTSLMIMISIAVKFGWHLRGFDIVAAYPHSPIDEDIYVRPAEGYPLSNSTKVLHLRRALYGTKQAVRCWWKHFSTVLSGMGCKFCINDQSFYVLKYKGDTALLWIHVDDGAICGSTPGITIFIRECLMKSFEVTWTDELSLIVGIKISRTDKGIFLSQPTLTASILENCGFPTSRVSTPMIANLRLETLSGGNAMVESSKYLSILGSLSYLAIGTRPDIAFGVNFLSRFSSRPGTEHWAALKHLLKYVSGTKTDGILFTRDNDDESLVTYCDASWGGEFSRSTHGFVVMLFGNPVSWASRRQSCVATSTCHAEYMALGVAARESIWIQNLLMDIFSGGFVTTIRCDNTAAIKVAYDLHLTKRSHHVAREFHYVNEQVHDGNLKVEWVDSQRQKADILTKGLGHILFTALKKVIGMISL